MIGFTEKNKDDDDDDDDTTNSKQHCNSCFINTVWMARSIICFARQVYRMS